jgi:hypothetical protein
MESFAREYLGSVYVESGAIRIQDAMSPGGGYLNAFKAAKTLEGFAQTARDMFIGTFFEEGRYSVFGRRNEQGELISIEILLDETETEQAD